MPAKAVKNKVDAKICDEKKPRNCLNYDCGVGGHKIPLIGLSKKNNRICILFLKAQCCADKKTKKLSHVEKNEGSNYFNQVSFDPHYVARQIENDGNRRND